MILAYDIATTTGWCAGGGAETPAVGHVRLPSGKGKDDLATPFDFWDRWLARHIEEWKPDLVVFEAPLLPRPSVDPNTGKVAQNTTMATVKRLSALQVFVELHCHRRNIPCYEVAGPTIKKRLAGSGKATKLDMVSVAKRAQVPVSTHDEADAFGVWLVAVQYYAKQHQMKWDRALYSTRGLGI